MVLGVVEGNGGVRKGQVEQREQASCLVQVGVVGERGVLGKPVPGNPGGWCPELRGDGLVGRPAGTGLLPQALYFVDGLDIGVTGESGRRRRPELSGVCSTKGVTSGHWVNTAGAKVGAGGR